LTGGRFNCPFAMLLSESEMTVPVACCAEPAAVDIEDGGVGLGPATITGEVVLERMGCFGIGISVGLMAISASLNELFGL